MSILTIPTAIGSAISSLTSHGHKKGLHGGGASNPLNSTSSASASSDAQSSGSTQSLFGNLLDSVEQVVGIQTPTASTATPVHAPLSANSLIAGAASPSTITAAQEAVKKL